MYRLALADKTPPAVIPVMNGHRVPFTEMAEFRQPAALIIAPLLCRDAVDGPVRYPVCVIIMPEAYKASVLAAGQFPGRVIFITLRPAVKTRLLHQAVQHIVIKGMVAAVLVCQLCHPSGRVIRHLSRQSVQGDVHGIAAGVILCFAAAAVRQYRGGQVACGVVLIPGFMALRILPADQSAAIIVCLVNAQPFLAVNGGHLSEAVIFITGFIAGTVAEGE